MNMNMLRNMIELSDRPGGYTMDDFYANFPNNEDTWLELGALTDAGLIRPKYNGDAIENYEITADGTRYFR